MFLYIIRVVQIGLIVLNGIGLYCNVGMTSDINSAAEEAEQA